MVHLAQEDEDEDDEEIEQSPDLEGNGEEDEFGLPSVAYLRKITRRALGPSPKTPKGHAEDLMRQMSLGQTLERSNTDRSGTSDIAEERHTPEYPEARKHGKKILRPQYKDILEGTLEKGFLRVRGLTLSQIP